MPQSSVSLYHPRRYQDKQTTRATDIWLWSEHYISPDKAHPPGSGRIVPSRAADPLQSSGCFVSLPRTSNETGQDILGSVLTWHSYTPASRVSTSVSCSVNSFFAESWITCRTMERLSHKLVERWGNLINWQSRDSTRSSELQRWHPHIWNMGSAGHQNVIQCRRRGVRLRRYVQSFYPTPNEKAVFGSTKDVAKPRKWSFAARSSKGAIGQRPKENHPGTDRKVEHWGT